MSPHKYIRLHSGRRFYYRRPTVKQFALEDFVWSLSRLPRFLGHTDGEPYVVLHHMCLCHDIVVGPHKREALCHDFGEALLQDLPSPLKVLVPDYLDHEHRIEKVIARAFGFVYPFPAAVKVADLTMLATEMRWLTKRRDYLDLPYSPLKVSITPWAPEKARREFMRRWSKLPALRA